MKINFSHSVYQNILLLLLFMSGTLKNVTGYFDYPFDITLQILILIIIDILYCLGVRRIPKFKRVDIFFLGLVLVFYISAIFSLSYTTSESYGYVKAVDMFIPLIGFLYVKFIRILDLEIWYKVLLYILIPITVFFILFKYLLWAGKTPLDFLIDKPKFNLYRRSYLNIGYLLGILAILSVRFSKRPLIIIGLNCLLILGLGSRGAVIFLFLSLIIVYFKRIIAFITRLKIRLKILKRVFLFFITTLFVGVFFIDRIAYYFDYGLTRFASLLNPSSDISALGRIDQYTYVIENGFTFQGFTIGYGLGSFGINYYSEDVSAYPHNIFLEVWYEMGFLVMLIFIAFLCFPFFLKRAEILKALALFAFFNAMKTLSFANDRNLFILIGILIFVQEYIITDKSKITRLK